jgi:hypothetical protein
VENPYIIGGDFNIMRKAEDKSTDNFDTEWSILFNVVIESLDLKEVSLYGRQYTWARPGDDPTFEKFDSVLVSTDWEDKYPMATVEARDRNISAHSSKHWLFHPTEANNQLSDLRGVGCSDRASLA